MHELLVSTLITRRPRGVPSTMSTSPSSSARASLVSPVKTHLATLPSQGGQLRTGKSDVYQQPTAFLILLALCCSIETAPRGNVDFLSPCPSHVHQQGDVGDEVDDVKIETCIAKRGSLCESRKLRKTVAPTADEGWMCNPGMLLVVCIRDVLGGRTSLCRVMCMVPVSVPHSHSKHHQVSSRANRRSGRSARRRGSNAAGARCSLYDTHTMCNFSSLPHPSVGLVTVKVVFSSEKWNIRVVRTRFVSTLFSIVFFCCCSQ